MKTVEASSLASILGIVCVYGFTDSNADAMDDVWEQVEEIELPSQIKLLASKRFSLEEELAIKNSPHPKSK